MPSYIDPYQSGAINSDQQQDPGNSSSSVPWWVLPIWARARRTQSQIRGGVAATDYAGGESAFDARFNKHGIRRRAYEFRHPKYWNRAAHQGEEYGSTKTCKRMWNFAGNKDITEGFGNPVNRWRAARDVVENAAPGTAGANFAFLSDFIRGSGFRGGVDAMAGKVMDSGYATRFASGLMSRAFEQKGVESAIRMGARGLGDAAFDRGAALVGENALRGAAVRGAGLALDSGLKFVPILGEVLIALQIAKTGINAANRVFQGSMQVLNSATKDMNVGILKQGFQEYDSAPTGRARAIQQIQNSRLNARSIIGSEAAFFASQMG